MDQSSMNFWAILTGTILCLGAGFLWYGPLFGIVRQKSDRTPKEVRKRYRTELLIGPAFILLFMIGMIVAALLPAGSDWSDGVLLGAILGLGPAAGVGLNAIFSKGSFPHFLIDGGYLFIVFVIFGIITGVWHV